tara:strand:- start:441 stop:1466 length:1026 start_codon:yes stop_codon:yes gene_type:complete
MSSDITIIIPTKNRSNFLKKCIEYYLLNNFKGTLLILDSSNIKENKKNKEIILKNKNKIKINIFYKDDFPTQIIKNFIDEVKTKYCIMASDDDFYVVKTINYFVDYLNSHPEYNIISGKALRLDIVNKDRILVNKYFISDNLDNDDPLERVSHYINRYGPINTSVISKEYLKNIFEITPPKDELDNICPIRSIYDEMLVGALMVLSSKIAHMENLLLIRTIHGNNSNISKDLDKKKLEISINFFTRTIKKYAINYLDLSDSNKGYDVLKKDMYNYFKRTPKKSLIKNNLYSILHYTKYSLYKFFILRFLINKIRNNYNLIDNYINNQRKFYNELEIVRNFL